jgi:DNA-binding transcriptional ArsR family regulator
VDPDLLLALKALSDASRLRIVGLVAGRPMAVEQLADELGLSAPTVAHHLKRLKEAGLVVARPRPPHVEYALRLERLAEVGRKLDALEDGHEEPAAVPSPWGPMPAFEAKVFRAFFDGDQLVAIPASEKKRQVILRYLLERCFPDDREYGEREVTERLAEVHAEDPVTLRRALVDAGLLTRSAGVYRRA